MKAELDDKFARGSQAVPGIYFDRDTRSPRGFLLRVTPAGARAWCLNYRVRDTGVERRITIGDVKSWPIIQARKRAHELRRAIDIGGDPLRDIRDIEESRAAPTVAQLFEKYAAEILPTLAPRTQHEHRAMAATWILPAIGRRKVADVKREDIAKLHRHVTNGSSDKSNPGGPRRANMVKSLVSVLFNEAIKREWRPPHTNPCELVDSNSEGVRERYLTGDEIVRLIEALDGRKSPRWRDSVDTIMLALLTGARRGQVLGMGWDDLDLDAGVWTKPVTENRKQGKVHRTPLSADAVTLLRLRKSSATPALRTVFRRGNSPTARSRLDRDWSIIRADAGLDDVRFHDLRHSYASLLVGEGESLPVVGKMLGHSKPATTARYAHLADKPLRVAAEKVAKLIRGG